jgi:hypothetical protein
LTAFFSCPSIISGYIFGTSGPFVDNFLHVRSSRTPLSYLTIQFRVFLFVLRHT